MRYFLGIDTSCYTTSVALIDMNKLLVADERTLLDVSLGERGLSQSEAVFQHVKKLPGLIERAYSRIDPHSLAAIAVSTTPRCAEESYMPVFKVGEAVARSLAAANKLPLFETSHQSNHILAGRWSAGGPDVEDFLVLHISGGTTELHRLSGTDMRQELLGTSNDLHAGQFVDRVGVALGLPFPAGPALEQLAIQTHHTEVALPSSVRDFTISFSGPESQAQRWIKNGCMPEAIALAVFRCIAKSIEKILRKAIEETKVKDVLIVGGVASNSIIRQILHERIEHRAVGGRLFFAAPEFSRDNAVGTALWACQQTIRHSRSAN